MADELAKKIAEAREAMFPNFQPSGGKIVILSKGDADISSSDPKVEVRKIA